MVKLRNDPFPYCHLYNVLLGTIHGQKWQTYVLHCDYSRPEDKRNIAEVKHRLGWSRHLHIYKVTVLKKDYVNGNCKKTKNTKHVGAKVE